MRVVPLQSGYKDLFWKEVNRDVPDFFFFALDWKYQREDAQIMLALKDERIDGMMLVFKRKTVHLRGSPEAAKALLEKLELEKLEFVVEEEHKPYVLKHYSPKTVHQIILMVLHRGDERPQVKHPVATLEASDADRIAGLMRNADPEFWGETTSQDIMEGLSRGTIWCGIRIGEELVSVGSVRLTEWAGIIGVVAMHEAHRNKGCATSIVSKLVSLALEKIPLAIIFVLSENAPARRVYETVGFKKYKTYFFMRGEKI